MRTFLRSLLAATIVVGIFAAAPTSAAPSPYTKKLDSTIMIPMLDVGTWFGAGYGNWTQTEDAMAPLRQNCPDAGSFDGYTWRFFDLKGAYTKFYAHGPEALITQEAPADLGTFHDYDIDLWLFDAKCNRIDVEGSNGGGGFEKMSTGKKQARYAVIVYWYGVTPNIPVTLEYGA